METEVELAKPKRPPTARKGDKIYGRSKVSNGKDLLPGIDGRSLIARRFRDISNAIISDQAGLSEISEARLQLIRRFSACAVLAEEMESQMANGVDIDIAKHALLCSSLVRLAQRIGIGRRSRNITPQSTLADMLDELDVEPVEGDQ
jgi:hypothetical protein